MFVTPDGQRADVVQSRKRTPKPSPTLLDPGVRRRRTMLVGLAVKHGFAADELAVMLNVTARHVRREAARFRSVARRLGEARDAG